MRELEVRAQKGREVDGRGGKINKWREWRALGGKVDKWREVEGVGEG